MVVVNDKMMMMMMVISVIASNTDRVKTTLFKPFVVAANTRAQDIRWSTQWNRELVEFH